jgi:hypothetical protein
LRYSVEYSVALTETVVEMRPMYAEQALNRHRELVEAAEKEKRAQEERNREILAQRQQTIQVYGLILELRDTVTM